VVVQGRITAVNGLPSAQYEIRNNGSKADLELPYRLVLGMTLQTTGDITDTITVTADVNYTSEYGTFELHLQADGTSLAPFFNSAPDTLQYEITLGTGAGEHPAFGRSSIGARGTPWDSEGDDHKTLRDDDND